MLNGKLIVEALTMTLHVVVNKLEENSTWVPVSFHTGLVRRQQLVVVGHRVSVLGHELLSTCVAWVEMRVS